MKLCPKRARDLEDIVGCKLVATRQEKGRRRNENRLSLPPEFVCLKKRTRRQSQSNLESAGKQ
jgi:hypothetical protein